MTAPMRLPAGSYFDDPGSAERAAQVDALAIALTRLEIVLFYDWISRSCAPQQSGFPDLGIFQKKGW